MSRAREIQRLRQEIELLDRELRSTPQEAHAGSLATVLESERARHQSELEALRREHEAVARKVRAQAEQAIRRHRARVRELISEERGRADRANRESERLSDSLRASRQEAAGYRLILRQLERRLGEAEAAREAAETRVADLLRLLRSLAPEREQGGDRVVSLTDRPRARRDR